MASAPRSSGTDSLDTFRDALSKSMPGPGAEPDDEELRELVREALARGPKAIREVAAHAGVAPARVVRLLGLPGDTSPDQQVVTRTEPARPMRKGRARS